MIFLLFALFISSVEARTTYSCDIEYDEMNIPHVKTTSLEGFYYCFGLNHGQDRAWAMDYFRRITEGRNAEVLGFSQLRSDLMMRLLDLPTVAEKLWIQFSHEHKRMLEVYTDGVNKGFETGKNAIEFKDSGFGPEPWRPQHSLQVLLLQSFDQTRKTFMRDYEEEKAKTRWGTKASVLFDEDDMPWENNILKEGEYQKMEGKTGFLPMRHSPAKLWAQFPTLFGYESGSNNWVVSKEKSRTGKAILANDPHLDLKTPMFWYWISLKTPQMSVMGGSVPGVPMIASGTNGKVSWGLTNSYLNSADIVYLQDVTKDQLETIRPVVKIKFGFLQIPFFFKSFERLKSGHRILPLEVEADDKIALKWTGFTLTPEEIYPMFDLFKVKDVAEMDQLLSQIGIPSWNFVFADHNGDIGFRLVGKTYKQIQKTSLGIPKMSVKEFLNESFLTPSERPHVLRPKRQYVYTANNRHWPSDSEFYGGRAYSASIRGFRIDELLKGNQDVESFKNIQCDSQVVDARFFLQKILKNIDVPEFNNWTMLAEDQSKVLPVYRRLMDLMMEKWEVNEYALFKMLDHLNKVELKDLRHFYQLALSDVNGRTWGEMHRLNFPHMSKKSSWAFSPDIAGVGDTHSVNPGTAKWNSYRKVYEQNSGASMRMIIEMEKTPRIWLALPGLNRDYAIRPPHSPWEDWKNCHYTEIKF